MNGRTVTLALRPTALTVDDLGVTVAFDGNVTGAKDPSTPAAPGSVFHPEGTQGIPTYASAPGFYVSLNDNAINRALFASWQAGFFNLTIDEAFLQQFNARLPFQLNSNLITAFFPQLPGQIPPGNPIPLALRFTPQLPPVVRVGRAPDLLTLGLGELHLAVQLDFGSGYQDVLTLAFHVQMGVDVMITDDRLTFTVLPSQRVQGDVIDPAPAPLREVDVERFLRFVVPPAIQLAASSIRPIPLPPLQGLTLLDLRIYADGQQQEFVTVEGNVR
jgi:hypothetical protein